MRDAALYGKHPDDQADDRRAGQVLPVSLRAFALDVRRPEVGRRSDRPDHERRAERRRGARVPPRARRLVRGSGRRVARGSADAAAARAWRRSTGRASSRRSCSRQKRSGGEIFLAPALSSDGKNDRVSRRTAAFCAARCSSTSGSPTPRPASASRSARQEHARPELRGAAAALLAERVLARRPHARRHRHSGTARTCSTCSTSRDRKIERRSISRLEGATSPSWSPDGKPLVFSGTTGGITDLYIVNADGTQLRRLTNDHFGDLQPQWSPDGKTIAFASDRDSASFELLRFQPWRITLLDVATARRSPCFPGRPDSTSIRSGRPTAARSPYVSDRNGTANIFLYDLDAHAALSADERRRRGLGAHRVQPGDQLGAQRRPARVHVLSRTRNTPIWTVTNPRGLKKAPYRDRRRRRPCVGGRRSVADCDYACGEDRVSVAALLDSFDLALPDTSKFRSSRIRITFASSRTTRRDRASATRPTRSAARVRRHDRGAERHARQQPPRDLRRDQRPVSEARAFLGYTNLAHRWQYSDGLSQAPYYFLSSDSLRTRGRRACAREPGDHDLRRAAGVRRHGVSAQPLHAHRVRRGFNNIDRSRWFVTRRSSTAVRPARIRSTARIAIPTLNYVDGQVALVSDNTLFGYTGPIMGRRYRLQVSPVDGRVRLDAVSRRLPAVRSDPLQLSHVATRLYADLSIGPDEDGVSEIHRPPGLRARLRSEQHVLS